ncbi:MAG TPA: IS1380 family transposase [Nitrospirota bacterium]|nr:IS1380 family transposase [Nitrospirota bacterium]
METQCTPTQLEFHALGRREVVGKFDGGTITSDAGGLLLRETEKRTGILSGFARCFEDLRNPDLIEHTVAELVAQRIYGLALGYEDLNDHDDLRRDPLFAVLVGKGDPEGEKRERERDRGKASAGKSTLNRLELTPAEPTLAELRYKKIIMKSEEIDRLMVDVFLQAHAEAPEEIVLDVDATDDPLHGNQEGRFFHGYYMNYCYLPLYIFCGEFLLCARLRPSNIDASEGTAEEVERIVGQIRKAWPDVNIVVRGDSGFCRDGIMTWCEGAKIDYVFGLAKNERLKAMIAEELKRAQELYEETKAASRVFKDFRYETRESWTRERRVVAKAEHLDKGANPRFVVTSIGTEQMEARTLYERLYCGRGDMENRIKEQQLWLFADRTSAGKMRANQLRLYFSSVAYMLMQALRRLGLQGTQMAAAQCNTIRLKLLKIGAQVKVTVRKVWISLAGGYPYVDLFQQVFRNLQAASLRC